MISLKRVTAMREARMASALGLGIISSLVMACGNDDFEATGQGIGGKPGQNDGIDGAKENELEVP
jgi:hypothetical protein